MLTKNDAPDTKPNATTEDELRAEHRRAVIEARKITDAALLAERELTDEEARRCEDLLTKADGLNARIKLLKKNFSATPGDLAQLAVSVPGAPPSKALRGSTWGAAVVRQASDQYGRFKGLTPSGATLVQVEAPEPVALGRPVTSLRSLIPSEQNSGVFSFLRQTVRTNNAAVVAKGALKPTSPYAFELVEDRARVVAHLSEPIPRQDLADAPALTDFIRAEMSWGCERALEAEILTGSGTGEHMTGLANTAGIQTVSLIGATAIEKLRTLRRGITRLEAQGLVGTGFVMNPSDWEDIETLATTGGELLMSNAGQNVPVDSSARRLWGIPVVSTPSAAQGTAWLADFQGSTKLYLREEVRLDWSENTYDPDALGDGVGASDFQLNYIRFRAEMRAGFAVTRPSGVVRIALTA